jgi:hypothetical protein
MDKLIATLSFWYYRYFVGYGLYRYTPKDHDADPPPARRRAGEVSTAAR